MKNLPRIVVDTREQRPLNFGRLPLVRKKLDFGDYSLRGFESRVAVERKSIQDLWGTLSQPVAWARFEREMQRAQLAGCRVHVVVEGHVGSVLVGNGRVALQPLRLMDRLWETCHMYGMGATFACGRVEAGHVVTAILRGAWRAESRA